LFIHWIVVKTNRQSGYVNDIAKDCNNCDCIDVMNVVSRAINDNKILMKLDDENKIKLEEIHKYIQLIFENLDSYVRSNHRILYPDEKDDDDSMLNCNMVDQCNSRLNDFMSSNTLTIDTNSSK
jgi:hypothetical protein